MADDKTVNQMDADDTVEARNATFAKYVRAVQRREELAHELKFFKARHEEYVDVVLAQQRELVACRMEKVRSDGQAYRLGVRIGVLGSTVVFAAVLILSYVAFHL